MLKIYNQLRQIAYEHKLERQFISLKTMLASQVQLNQKKIDLSEKGDYCLLQATMYYKGIELGLPEAHLAIYIEYFATIEVYGSLTALMIDPDPVIREYAKLRITEKKKHEKSSSQASSKTN